MRRSTLAIFGAFIALLLLAPIVWLGLSGADETLKPYLDLAARITRSYGCRSVTIRETGPKGATRLSIAYVVGERPTIPDAAREMKQVGDLALLVYDASPIVGVDVERRVPRETGGCEEAYDVQRASFERTGSKSH